MRDKKGFIVYGTLEEQLAFLTDEQVGQLFRGLFVHFRGEEPVLKDLMVKMVYTGVRGVMDRDREKWEKVRRVRQEAGRRGGLASGKSRSAAAAAKRAEEAESEGTEAEKVQPEKSEVEKAEPETVRSEETEPETAKEPVAS